MLTRIAIRIVVILLKVELTRIEKWVKGTPRTWDDDAVEVVEKFIELYESGGLQGIIAKPR